MTFQSADKVPTFLTRNVLFMCRPDDAAMHHLRRPLRALPTTAWDASITLTNASIDPGTRAPEQLAADIRSAVQMLPGARHLSVEVCERTPYDRWLIVDRSGSAEPVLGLEWDKVRRQIEAAVRSVARAPAQG